MFQTKVVEKIKTHILLSMTRFLESCRWRDNVENYFRAWQATDDNIAHAHCMLDNYRYKQTLRIYNSYCFCTTRMVARTRFSVTLYVHCLSFHRKPHF